MKEFNNTKIIGIDHGYGNMKTANCCFPTGVTTYEKEPVFKDNMLVWNGRYYLIGVEHKEFKAEKMLDEDYYVLTLAAIARELNSAKLYSADVFIAAGLPLTWVSEQKKNSRNTFYNTKRWILPSGARITISALSVQIFTRRVLPLSSITYLIFRV